jgi:hypothetical protein
MQIDGRRHVHCLDLVVCHEIAPVHVPAPSADLTGKWFDESGVGAGNGHELAPAADPEGLTDALADDIARADQAPTQRFQRFKGSKVLGF